MTQNEGLGGKEMRHARFQDIIDRNTGVPPLAAMDAVLMDNDQSTMIPGIGSTSEQLAAKRTCFCGKSFDKMSEFKYAYVHLLPPFTLSFYGIFFYLPVGFCFSPFLFFCFSFFVFFHRLTRMSPSDSKHYKRHWKRFQCPFPDCNLRFGTKDDWRRHDSRCHYQLGFWKCLFGGHPSCRAAYDLKTFEEHLDNVHLNLITNSRDTPEDPYITLQKAILSDSTRRGKFLKRCHNGQNNCEDNFWCGFCRRMIRIEDADFGLKAMNNRVDHIANHFANDAPTPGPDDGGVGSSTGGSASVVPPLTGMQGGPGGVGVVPLPRPPLLPPGGVPLGARGEAETPGPKWVHYEDWDMKDTERYIEDGVPQNDAVRVLLSGESKVEQR